VRVKAEPDTLRDSSSIGPTDAGTLLPPDGRPAAEVAPPPSLRDRGLVWPPPDGDVDEVEVVAMDWSRVADQDAPGRSVDPPDPPAPRAADPPTPAVEVETPQQGGRRIPRVFWVAAALLLAIGLGLLGGWHLRPFVAAPPSAVKVSIESTPPGADVSIDGTSRGATPLQLTLPPGDHLLALVSGRTTREVQLHLTAGTSVRHSFDFGEAGAAEARSTYGTLDVQTRPPGAQVVIGGVVHGVTPLTVGGLAAGPVDVRLIHSGRTLIQRVEIQTGKAAVLVVPMSGDPAADPGWLAVRSPIPLKIVEGGRVVGTTDSERIMLPGGRHSLEFVNEQLEVKIARTVAVQGGREVAVDVTPPQGLVNINARPWAEVFAQGTRLGETPLGNVSLPVGTHELVFSHPQLGERRQSVTVRASTAARVSVSFTP
jgi:hypothetical protein